MKLIFSILLLLCLPAGAATYYVDFATGANSNAGTSTGAPFKHCPGDDSATSTAASTALSAGDTVIFKGGVAYQGEVDMDWAGSSGNPITYDGNTSGAWGTGMAEMSLNETNYHAFNGNAAARDYITIKGFKIYGAKNVNNASNQTITRGGSTVTGINYGGSNNNTDYGAIDNRGGDYWVVADCRIYESANWSDRSVENAEADADPQTSASVPADQAGIRYEVNANHGMISNCTFWAIGRDCIRLTASTNIMVANCNFGGDQGGTNSGWFSVAIRVSGSSSAPTAMITIQDCLFHDGWQYQGDDAFQRSHAGDWIHAYGDDDGLFETARDPFAVLVERCLFYCDKVFSKTFGTAYSFLEDDVFNWTWRNNIFINSFSGSVEIERTSNVVFHANTFLDYDHGTGGGSPLYFFTGTSSSYPLATTLRNNIFATLNDNSAATPINTTSSGVNEYPTSDYNLFYSPNNGGNSVRWNGTSRTLAAWRTLSGQDNNSVYGAPGFVSQPADGSTSSEGDWHPAAGSAGIDLGQSGVTSTDYSGATRATPPDIGALEAILQTLAPARLGEGKFIGGGRR